MAGKSRSIVGCKLNTILGNAHAGYPNASWVEKPSNQARNDYIQELILGTGSRSIYQLFQLHMLLISEHYELKGKVLDTIVLNSSQGWSGRLELSFIEFEVKNQKGYGLILTG
ncbi:UNVERIFIED_CONTAM: hypothetical protein NCL1_18142 [Trichonephila clavipes]